MAIGAKKNPVNQSGARTALTDGPCPLISSSAPALEHPNKSISPAAETSFCFLYFTFSSSTEQTTHPRPFSLLSETNRVFCSIFSPLAYIRYSDN